MLPRLFQTARENANRSLDPLTSNRVKLAETMALLRHQATRATQTPVTSTLSAFPFPRRPAGRTTAEPIPYPNWTVLGWLLGFRALLAAALIVLFALGGALQDVQLAQGALIWSVLTGYLAVLALTLTGILTHWPAPDKHLQLSVFADLGVFTLLMHAAGGVTSGLGVLLAVAVAAGAILMEGRQSLLFASLAALAVIGEETYSSLYTDAASSSYVQAGLLGLTFFAVALLAQIIYRRIRATELLAAQRKVDIADLSMLNEYIIQSMATGVIAVDGEREVRLFNVAARQFLGAADIKAGTRLAEVSEPLAHWLDAAAAASSKDRRASHESITIGSREIRLTLQWLGDYRASGVLIFLEDQQEITQQAQQIKLASLGTLTASIAHNIRNPLSSISHAAQLLAESPALGEDDHHLLDIVRRNGGRIDEIIQSVLQLSRRQQAEPEEIDLVPWLGQLCEDFRASRGVGDEMVALCPDETELVVWADPRHLSQILINLCENAIKHGAQADGSASLELRVRRSLATILIEVIDDGAGIEPGKVADIFNPFYTTSSTGTGLGLYIARELAETNGILLEYSARQPHGSCFRLFFPT